MRKLLISDIRPGMVTSKNIIDTDGKLLLAEGTLLNQRHIRKLVLYNIEYVSIDDSRTLSFTSISKSNVLYEESFSAIKNIMNNVRNGKSIDVKLVTEIIEDIVAQIISDSNAFMQLSSIRDLDNYTFLHSIDVCIYSVILGKHLGFDFSSLRSLGTGSILHDIGKSRIPPDVLLKPSSLSREEFDIVKRHTVLGYEIIKDSPGLDELTASMALNHHERWDGSGYLRGVHGEQINLFSRIVSISDIYDALTADRVYRKRVLPHEAAEYILVNSGSILDPELVEVFIHKVAIYPVGSTVLLSTGEIGRIVAINGSMPLRPIIDVFSHIDEKISGSYLLDLRNNLTAFIEDVIN